MFSNNSTSFFGGNIVFAEHSMFFFVWKKKLQHLFSSLAGWWWYGEGMLVFSSLLPPYFCFWRKGRTVKIRLFTDLTVAFADVSRIKLDGTVIPENQQLTSHFPWFSLFESTIATLHSRKTRKNITFSSTRENNVDYRISCQYLFSIHIMHTAHDSRFDNPLWRGKLTRHWTKKLHIHLCCFRLVALV